MEFLTGAFEREDDFGACFLREGICGDNKLPYVFMVVYQDALQANLPKNGKVSKQLAEWLSGVEKSAKIFMGKGSGNTEHVVDDLMEACRRHLEKKLKKAVDGTDVYRPPKVRPKNLTIGRSVFLWLNIASNLRKKLLWHI